jgi:PhnB protein
MQAIPYLNFNGTCKEAFDFYAQVLNGKIEFIQTFGESPMAEHAPADQQDLVMHASLVAGGLTLLASDAPSERYEQPQGISVSLHLTDTAEADRIYAALSENGTIEMPIGETFWAARFAMFTDRFGIPWMLNCSNEAA